MKKLYYAFTILLFTFLATGNLKAQTNCAGITAEAVYQGHTTTSSYYAVRVNADRTYNQDITVTGTIYQDQNRSNNASFTVTILAGSTTAETEYRFFTVPIDESAVVEITSVSPCPNFIDPYWQNELENIGTIHNEAMDYAYSRLQQENLSNLTQSRIHELTATFVSEFYTNRYGQILNFTQSQLYSEVFNQGFYPSDPNSLNISDHLKQVLNSILSLVDQTDSPQDFESQVMNVVSQNINQLQEHEQLYLRVFSNVIVKSFEYWILNGDSWNQLFNNSLAALKKNGNQIDIETFTLTALHGPSSDHIENFTLRNVFYKPCNKTVVKDDAKGVVSGALGGCASGSIFGVFVGCAAGAIFFGGLSGASSSIVSAIFCAAQ